MVIRQFEVHLVKLDPTVGSEMRKTRPCVIVTPDEMNLHLNTVLVAPMTSSIRKYPYRVNCVFAGREGQIALDQIRCVDRSRVLKRLGHVDEGTQQRVRETAAAMLG